MPHPLLRSVEWRDVAPGRPELLLIDQTALPEHHVVRAYRDCAGAVEAIRRQVVQGAPAVTAAVACAAALAAHEVEAGSAAEFEERFRAAARQAEEVAGESGGGRARRALLRLSEVVADRQRRRPSERGFDIYALREALKREALTVVGEIEDENRAIGRYGSPLLRDGARVVIYGGVGALQGVSHGSALGVVRSAAEQGRRVSVLVCDSPSQGHTARLTAWELARDGILAAVLPAEAVADAMRAGQVLCALVGADALTAGGDALGEDGTAELASAAGESGVPLYVAAPLSSVEPPLAPSRWLGDSARCVTPAARIAAILTDTGIAYPPFTEALDGLSRYRL